MIPSQMTAVVECTALAEQIVKYVCNELAEKDTVVLRWGCMAFLSNFFFRKGFSSGFVYILLYTITRLVQLWLQKEKIN